MQKTKLGLMVKNLNLFGGNKKMKTERKNVNVLGTLFTLFMFIGSMFAGFVAVTPAVLAINGIGEVTPLAIFTLEENHYEVQISSTHLKRPIIPHPLTTFNSFIAFPKENI